MSPLIWNVDPILFELGPFSVKWYGLLFAISFMVGYAIVERIYRLEGKPVQELGSLLMVMMVATIVGARLGHCLFYDPNYYLSHPFEILKLWKGGLASHGGALGIVTGLLFYSKKHPTQPFVWLLDRIAIPVALAGSFIRLGNLFNSEIIGEPSSLPWAIVFARLDSIPRHPAQMYESMAYLIIFLVLVLMYRKAGPSIPRGRLIGTFLVLVFGARFAIEFMKTAQAAYSLPFALSVGQLLSIPAILVGFWLLSKSFSPKWSG